MEPRNARKARKSVHGWNGFGCGVFQEHEYARIDTNVYVMDALKHEKHEKHVSEGILAVKVDDKSGDFLCVS